MSVAVIVGHKLKEGQTGAYVEYMREMIALTKEEDGCIAYDLYEASDGSGECILVEIWESQEKLDTHMETDHFKKFIPGTIEYLDEPLEGKVYNLL